MLYLALIASFIGITGSCFFRNFTYIRLSSLFSGIVASVAAFMVFAAPLMGTQIFHMGPFVIDRFSGLMGVLITCIYLMVSIVSYAYVNSEFRSGTLTLHSVKWYYGLLHIFALAMFSAVSADNLALLWVSLELTTLATTPLVALYRKDGSLEAAWKYIILCSLGISFGLLGFFFIGYAGNLAGLNVQEAMSFSSLLAVAPQLSSTVMQWAFLFAFVGLGTKVGFFPLHTWLPDAHGRTPSPISAMLSGMLLNVAFAALLRIKVLTDHALGTSDWTDQFFLIFGMLSVVAAAFFLYIQHHYKRMLAYSSMEHMGILAIGVSMGILGLIASLMHMVAHTFSKSLLFFASGEILHHEGTAKIEQVRGLRKRMPSVALMFLLGMLSLLAAPPFMAFASEIHLFSAMAQRGRFVTLGVLIVALSIVAIGLLRHTLAMLATADHEEHKSHDSHPTSRAIVAVMATEIFTLAVLGVYFLSGDGYRFFESLAMNIINASSFTP